MSTHTTDLTSFSSSELSMMVFNTESLYAIRRSRRALFATLDLLFEYDAEQRAELESDLDADLEDEEPTTVVVFRTFKDGGDVIALFPTLVNYPDGACESYQHVGQHGAADYAHCVKITRVATPEEYAPLKAELESIGYRLEVRARFTPSRNRKAA